MEHEGRNEFMRTARLFGWDTSDNTMMRQLFAFASKLKLPEGVKPTEEEYFMAAKEIRKWKMRQKDWVLQVTGQIKPAEILRTMREAAKGGMEKAADLIIIDGGVKDDAA